jgi:phosphate-selective porin OprO/OprP
VNKKITVASIFVSLLFTVFSAASNAKKDDLFNLSGYLMLDYDFFDESLLEDVTGQGSQSEVDIRRARLSLTSDFNKDWEGKFQLGFEDGVEIKDAYLEYKGWSFADVIVGQQKENFGLEKLIGSRKLLMIERSMSTEAFAPGRSLGVSLEGELSSLLWQLGYYQPSGDEAQSAVTGRMVWLPWQEQQNLLHLGVAFSERDYGGNEFRINETLEVNFADSLLEGKKIDTDTVSLQGLEALWLQDRFTLMAEWQQAGVTSIEQKTYDYEGGYVQFGYQLSGGSREYKNGKLGNSSKNGWELIGRYSELTLKEEGESAETYAIGFNYTLSKNFKFMGDYIKTEYFEDGASIGDGDAVSVRIQYSF